MHREGIRKIPGGKTVKVEVEVEGGILKEVLISGDFFAYPPEALEELEESLKGIKAEPREIERVLESFGDRVELVGVGLEDLKELLLSLL